MRKPLYLIALSLLLMPHAFAVDTPPSEASVRELLVATHAKAQLTQALHQTDEMTEKWLKRKLDDMQWTTAQQKVVENARAQISSLIHRKLAWKLMEPLYIMAYQHAYTQEEISGIVAFLRSPAGQAFLAKSPALQKRVMLSVRAKLKALSPQLDEIKRQMVKKVMALEPRPQDIRN